jgi:Icc-related predicted phosphoesterase
VREFIERERPRMTLHGHIHESPDMSNSWRAVVGDTTCIQPGQSPDGGPLTYVLIDAEGWTSERRVDAE